MLTWLRKNTKTIMIAVAVLFIASMFYGLGYRGVKEMNKPQTGLIKINGRDVSPIIFNNFLQRARSNFPEKIKTSESLFIQSLALSQTIDFVIMLQDAEKNVGISGSEINQALEEIAKNQKFPSVNEFKKAVERSGVKWDEFKNMLKYDMLVQKRVRKIKESVSVSPNDLREIRAKHILIRIIPGKEEEARKLAENLLERVKKGEDFVSLAKKYSEDPGSKKNGGDLGFFSPGSMVKPFEELAFSLKVGDIGGPVKTDFGYHIIKVEDARLKKFKAGEDPSQAVLKEKQEKAFSEWSYNLRQNAKLEILNPALKALDLKFRGRMGEAVVEYQKAIASDPGNPYYHLFLGLIYEETGKLPLAIAEYKEAILRAPAEYNLYITLGEAYKKNGQTDLAVEQFKKASMIAGDGKKLHEELSKLFKSVKRPDLALSELKEISRIEKKEAFEKSLKEGTKVKTD